MDHQTLKIVGSDCSLVRHNFLSNKQLHALSPLEVLEMLFFLKKKTVLVLLLLKHH